MILDEPIKVIHKKYNKPYKIIGFVVDCTNVSDDEIMVLFKHYTSNEKADFVKTYTEFVEKYEVDKVQLDAIIDELKNIYTHSKVTAHVKQMPKFEEFEDIRNYVIENKRDK